MVTAQDTAAEVRLVTPDFMSVCQQALTRAALNGDKDAYMFMARHIPVYAQYDASPEQAAQAGCPRCLYLGLWASHWPGVEVGPHGAIWLFEKGLRREAQSQGILCLEKTYDTLLHEFDHALQVDHVLDAMAAEKRALTTSRALHTRP